jgi:hypothetical protein
MMDMRFGYGLSLVTGFVFLTMGAIYSSGSRRTWTEGERAERDH